MPSRYGDARGLTGSNESGRLARRNGRGADPDTLALLSKFATALRRSHRVELARLVESVVEAKRFDSLERLTERDRRDMLESLERYIGDRPRATLAPSIVRLTSVVARTPEPQEAGRHQMAAPAR